MIPKSPQPVAKRTDFFVAIAVCVMVFLTYFATACRTVYSGDSGDFLVATATVGVPHPSGYPLFVLAAHIFGIIFPVGEWSFRVNLFVAISGAIGAAYIYRFLALFLEARPAHRAASIFGALCMAWGTATWGQATISEVYTLGMAFLAALLFYTLRWVRTPEDGSGTSNNRLAGLCLLYGFALTNHLTIAFVFPLFLVLVIWHKPSLFGKQAWLLLPLIGLLLLPLSLYAYLPLAVKYSHSPIRWGLPLTTEAFFYHVTGRRYSIYMTPNSDVFRFSIKEYLGTFLPREFGVLLLFAVPGIIALIRDARLRPMGLLLLGIGIVQTMYGFNYATPDIIAYYLPSFLVIACCIGVGASVVAGFLTDRLSTDNRARSLGIASIILCVLPLLPLSANYGIVDKHADRREDDYALNLLESCPSNAVLVISQDSAFTLWYEQYIKKIRPDVIVIQYSLFTGSDISYWYADALRRAYPSVADDIPKLGAPSTDEAGLVAFLKKMLAKNHPVMLVPSDSNIPQPPRLQALGSVLEKTRKATPSDTTKPVMSPAAVSLDEWMHKTCDIIPYGLCVRLYPRADRSQPTPDLATTIRINAALWQRFRLNGVFADQWRTDDDPLHISMAGRYTGAITDFGQLQERAGIVENARDCYQKAMIIYPTKEATEGVRRLRTSR